MTDQTERPQWRQDTENPNVWIREVDPEIVAQMPATEPGQKYWWEQAGWSFLEQVRTTAEALLQRFR